MFENFTFRKGFLIGLVISLIMVASTHLFFAFPWLTFLVVMLAAVFLLNAIGTAEKG